MLVRVAWLFIAMLALGCRDDDDEGSSVEEHGRAVMDAGPRSDPDAAPPPARTRPDGGRPRRDAGRPFTLDGGLGAGGDGGGRDGGARANPMRGIDPPCTPDERSRPPDAMIETLAADPSCRAPRLHTPRCYVPPEDCDALRESSFCLFADGAQLHYIGLDTGRVCDGPSAALEWSRSAGSAFTGHDLVVCHDQLVYKFSLADGSFDIAEMPCRTVFDLEGAIVVQDADQALVRFASWSDLLEGRGEPLRLEIADSAFGSLGGEVVSSWYASNDVRLGRSDGSAEIVSLERFAGTVEGIDLASDGRIVIATNEGLHVFDRQSGRRLRTLGGGRFRALSCFDGFLPGELAQHPGWAASARPDYVAATRADDSIFAPGACVERSRPRYAPRVGGPELLVVVPASGDGEPLSVRDERSTPHMLVIFALVPQTWHLEVAPEAQLEHVMVHGVPAALLETSADLLIEYRVSQIPDLVHDWPDRDSGRARRALERELGRPVTEYGTACWTDTLVIRDVPPLCW